MLRTMTIVRLCVPAGEECCVGVVEALLGEHAAGTLRLVTSVQHLQHLPAETANKRRLYLLSIIDYLFI